MLEAEKTADAIATTKAKKNDLATVREEKVTASVDSVPDDIKSMFRGGKYQRHMLLEVNRATAKVINKQDTGGIGTLDKLDKSKSASKASLERFEKSLDKVKKDAVKQAQDKASSLAKELRR